jgi:hypothetical protein
VLTDVGPVQVDRIRLACPGARSFEWLGLTREVTFALAADVPARHTRLVWLVRVSEGEMSPHAHDQRICV